MSSPRKSFEPIVVAALAVAAAVVVWRWLAPPVSLTSPPVRPGDELPPMSVAGWLNVPEGQSFDPRGKLVVVDFWATWCPPCVREIPRLAEVKKQYGPLGVEFVGLTTEGRDALSTIEEFIASTPGFDWPVGYGAGEVSAALNVSSIPMIVLYGPDGRARWAHLGAGATDELQVELDKALAAAK